MLAVLSIFSLNFYKANQYSADTVDEIDNAYSSNRDYNVEITKSGQIIVDGKKIKKNISLLSDSDELRIPVIDNSGKFYNSIQIELKLPERVAGETKTEFLAIHGVGETNIYVKDADKIIYSAENVSPAATLSIVAKLPKSTITPTIYMKGESWFLEIKSSYWIIIGISLPVITIAYMLIVFFYLKRRQKIDIPEKESPTPPMALPPSVVGVLFNQKVGSREIAATIVDLALRGDIIILDEERGFSFGKGKFDQRLLDFEKMLLAKIFRNNLSSDRQEIERRINNHFYSKKISLVSAGIYALATRLGYFKVNPQKTHAKYRFFGIGLFIIGFAGFLISEFYLIEPKYLIFFWIGMMLASLIITYSASYMPNRTVIGQEIISNWLAFKKFLSNPEPILFEEKNQQVFQKYLPYAIVMNCEAAWAKRFANHNFTIPEWFLTEKSALSLEDFCLSLFPIISYVGRSLALLKEPGFE